MNTSKPIQIFKPGTHTAMSGVALSFSESDLAATVAAYDPAKHEAPIVVGHPKHDNPAFGWVRSLAFADGGLDAEPVQVNPDFAEMVKSGAFKKISAAFYSPSAPNNPVPGVYYLRHVGFLGGQAPAVKGLRTPEFAEAEEGVVEFGDWDDRNNAGLWRGLRDWIIGKFGLEEADKALPKWDVQSLSDSAAQPEIAAAFTEHTHPHPNPPLEGEGAQKGDEMSAEDQARLAVLEAENTKLKADQAAFAEAEKTRERKTAHAGHLAFAEGLVQAGTLLPAQKDVAVAALDHFGDADKTIEFGEGVAKQPLIEGFKTFLQALPKQVEFGEVAKPESAGDTVEFAAPSGYTVEAGQLEIHHKALAYQAAHPNTLYQTAVKAVGGN